MLWYQQRRIVFWVTAHSHVLVDPALLPNTVMWRVNSSSTSFLHFPLLQHNTHTHNIQILQNGDGSVPSTRIGLLDTRTSKMEKSRSRRSILVSSRGSKTRCMPIHRVSDSRTMCKIRRHRYMDVFNGANTSRTVAVL